MPMAAAHACVETAQLKPDWGCPSLIVLTERVRTIAYVVPRSKHCSLEGAAAHPTVHADSEQRSAALALGAHGVYRLCGKARVQYSAFD